MAKITYTIHLTFRAPGLVGSFRRQSPAPRRDSFRIMGTDGVLVAEVKVTSEDGPNHAAMLASELVARQWSLHGSGGPVRRISWRAERERVLAGRLRRRKTIRNTTEIQWDAASGFRGARPSDWGPDDGGPDDGGPDDGPGDDGPDDGGMAGVREPRRPKPAPPSMSMELPLP